MADKAQAIDRFTGRAPTSELARLHRGVEEVVAREGGPGLLARIHDQVAQYVQSRPGCAVVQTSGRNAQQTYDEVVCVLERDAEAVTRSAVTPTVDPNDPPPQHADTTYERAE